MIGKMRLGIVLDDAGAEAALVVRRWNRVTLAHACRIGAASNGLDPFDAEGIEARFAEIVRAMPAAARRADVEAVLCLPEPVVQEDLLDFATFPAVREEAEALVRHRVARENWLEAGDLVCSHAVIPPVAEGGAVSVRARWMARALRDGLEAAGARAGLRFVRIDSWSGFVEAAPAIKAQRDRVLLSSDGKSWMLLCQCDQGADLLDSGWVEPGGEDGVAEKVLRLVRTYLHRHAATVLPFLIEAPEALREAIGRQAAPLGLSPSALVLDERFAGRAARVAAWA